MLLRREFPRGKKKKKTKLRQENRALKKRTIQNFCFFLKIIHSFLKLAEAGE